jgi:hypothetical protein
VLTGRETVPAAFAATAYRNGWTDLARRVRHLALGMGDAGTVPCPTTDAGALAALAAGATLDFDRAPVALDEDALLARGRDVDERDPDAFERAWSAIAPGAVAAIGDGGNRWTHGGLLWAARSFAQGVGAGAGVTVSVSDATEPDGLDGVRRFVVRTLVPAVTGARLVERDAAVAVRAAEETVDATRPLVASLPTGRRRQRGAAADARASLGLASCRLALVTGEASVAVDWLQQLGVAAEPLAVVPACAGPISAGRPLPGVTVAVADDGEVLVRSDAVALDRCDDGWLHTGRFD